MARIGSRPRTARRRLLGVYAVACALVGAAIAALILPQYNSDATTSAASTTYKTAVNEVTGSTAASSDAPGGAVTGTAKPGDTLKWAVSYQNNTTANASVSLTDALTNAGTYIPGSLELPPNQNALGALTPQYSTDNGASWQAGTPPTGATGVGLTGTLAPQGTQQLSLPFTVPPALAIAMTGGDAYNVVVYKQQVYALNHHRTGRVVFCARLDGTTCSGWPTDSNLQYWSAAPGAPIGTGTQFAGSTAHSNGAWIFQDKLYWYTGPSDSSSAGLACLDLATPTPTSCGYLPRTGKVVSNTVLFPQVGGTGIPASDGNRYSATIDNGSAVIMCVTPTADACSTPIPSLMAGVTSTNLYTAAAFGDYVFASVQQTTAASWKTFCYNVRTTARCAGNWPTDSSPVSAVQGNVFAPVLSGSGTPTGVCTISNNAAVSSVCWNLSGAVIANPYAGSGAFYNGGGYAAGDSFVVGARVYLSIGDEVICRTYATYSGTGAVPACAGFTNVPNTRNYTVRSAEDLGVDCLVATGDAGQIRFFDASTGGSCTNSGAQTATVTPTGYYCGTGATAFRGWTALTLPGGVSTAYTNAVITLRDQNGTIIPNFNGVRLTAGGTLNLTAIPTSVTSISATVTITGVRDAKGVQTAQISIAWQGDPPQMCFRTTAPPVSCDATAAKTLSNSATAITISATGRDSPGGNTTGAVQFVERADASQCSLAIHKTSPVQSARPGDTVQYSITVRNTGTQAYDSARFTDDLTDLLTESVFRNDHSATVGTVTYAQPVLSWSGALAAGATATVTYSVTVISPDPGDHTLINTVVSTSPQNNCSADSADPACTTTVLVKVTELLWHKVDATAAPNILPGAEWTLIPVNAAGNPTGPAIVVTDCVAETNSECSGSETDAIGGLFHVTNLGPGQYQLTETRAPVGFVINPAPIPVTIGPTALTVPLEDIVNKQAPVPVIPLTGGLGTDALSFSGGGLMAGVLALAVWHLLRRRRAVS